MKKDTRRVKYEFTCHAGHVNRREVLIKAETVDEATDAIKKKELICDYCFGEPAGRSHVVVTVNDLTAPSEEVE